MQTALVQIDRTQQKPSHIQALTNYDSVNVHLQKVM